MLESDTERLSQGLRHVQCAHPHTCSGSCLHSRSLDRKLRSMSRPQQERRVTFQELEVEPDPEERPYTGALGRSSRIFPESGDGVPPSAQRQETAHPLGRSMACQDAKGRGNGLPNGYALLVDGTHHHSRGGGPTETCSEDPCLLCNSSSWKQGLSGSGVY